MTGVIVKVDHLNSIYVTSNALLNKQTCFPRAAKVCAFVGTAMEPQPGMACTPNFLNLTEASVNMITSNSCNKVVLLAASIHIRLCFEYDPEKYKKGNRLISHLQCLLVCFKCLVFNSKLHKRLDLLI